MDLFLDVSDFDMLGDLENSQGDLDFDQSFSPMPRERANTWHGPPRGTPKEDVAPVATTPVFADDGVDSVASSSVSREQASGSGQGVVRKATARRNAWGNMSYADLIAKAIESSPEKRLTLSEIYAWLVENVPFFKDKGDTNSSAGWKNSIRHNLSLHSRFIRVQNEGAGKSSWWTVNPDKGPTKVPRRRAATMDNAKALCQKRGRQRRPEPSGLISSTSQSSIGCDLDTGSPSFFPRSPEFHGRVSTGSTGRLSPIPATFEVDMEPVISTTTQPGGSIMQWDGPNAACADALSESLAGILMDDLKPSLAMMPGMTLSPGLSSNTGIQSQAGFLQSGSGVVNFQNNVLNSNQYLQPIRPAQVGVVNPAGVKTDIFCVGEVRPVTSGTSMLCVGGNMSGNCGFITTGIQMSPQQQLYKTPSVNDLLLPNIPKQLATSPLTASGLGFSAMSELRTNEALASPTSTWVQQEFPKQQEWPNQAATGWPKVELEPQTRQRSFTFSSGKLDQNMLKQLLMSKPHIRNDVQKLLQHKRQQLFAAEQSKTTVAMTNPMTSPIQSLDQLQLHPKQPHSHHSMLEQLLTGDIPEPSAVATTQLSDNFVKLETKMDITPSMTLPSNPSSNFQFLDSSDLPSDLDLSYLNTESTTDIECNIDQVIEHELTYGDGLDFTFDPLQPNWGKSNDKGSNGGSLADYLSY